MSANLDYLLYCAAQVKKIDQAVIARQFFGDSFTLMHRAAQKALESIQLLWPDKLNLIIFCGPGNNGGDGLVLANLALEKNYKVSVVLIADSKNFTEPSTKAYQELNKNKLENFLELDPKLFTQIIQSRDLKDLNADQIFHKLNSFCSLNKNQDYIAVDALFGIGLNKPPQQIFQVVIDIINQAKAIFAIDIPSGLEADTGYAHNPTVKANATLTYIALKQGLFTGSGPDCTGKLLFANLGVDSSFDKQRAQDYSSWLLTKDNLPVILKPRLKNSHKHQFGHVVVIGGSQNMAGAIIMAGKAALRSGAGMVSLVTDDVHLAWLHQNQPELMIYSNHDKTQILNLLIKASAIVIGPGLGSGLNAKIIFNQILEIIINNNDKLTGLKAIIIDADGLRFLADYNKKSPGLSKTNFGSKLVLTPHPGEARTLLDSPIDISKNRFLAASLMAKQYNATVILKGVGSIIYPNPNFNHYLNSDSSLSNIKPAVCAMGNPGMATAGMGDILCGVIAALASQELINERNIFHVCCLAVAIHAEAGDRQAVKKGQIGLLATDLLEELRILLNSNLTCNK